MSTRVDRLVLAVGASGDAGAVFAALSGAYTVHADPAATMHWTWLDTADWRLHRAAVALREERHGRVRELVAERPEHDTVTSPVSGVRWPSRLDRLPDSPVRAAIAGTVGVRALLPVAEVETRRILLRLMDAAGKTRVRVSVDQQRLLVPRRAALPLHIAVRPLRGYDRDARRCVDLLGEAMGAETTTLSPTDAALSAAGRLPGRRVTDAVTVDPDDPAVRPVARALLDYVEVVDDARDGALADLDIEYLHELRSAIRATRALLSAAGHLLPGRSAVRVERDLGWLDDQTARLRAVDIALLEVGGDGVLDVRGLTALDSLREALLRRRRTELRRMRSTLTAPRAPAAFTAWRDDLTGMLDADVIGPSAAEAAGSLTGAAFDALGAAPETEFPQRLAALCEVLTAFGTLERRAPGDHDGHRDAERARHELAALRELLRLRDHALIVGREVRAAAVSAERGTGLPVDALLDAGAVVDRAAGHAAALGEQVSAARADLLSRRGRRRIEGLA